MRTSLELGYNVLVGENEGVIVGITTPRCYAGLTRPDLSAYKSWFNSDSDGLDNPVVMVQFNTPVTVYSIEEYGEYLANTRQEFFSPEQVEKMYESSCPKSLCLTVPESEISLPEL